MSEERSREGRGRRRRRRRGRSGLRTNSNNSTLTGGERSKRLQMSLQIKNASRQNFGFTKNGQDSYMLLICVFSVFAKKCGGRHVGVN